MRKVLGFSVLALALASGSAFAGDSTGSMQVQADVINTCYIQSAALDFGEVPGVINTPVDGVGNVDLQCTPDTSWTITFDSGLNNSIPVDNSRAMVQGADFLSYSLYSDAAYSVEMNTQPAPTGIMGVSSATGGVQSVPVYGRIPAGQIVRSNWYGDTVVATVQF